MAAGDLALALLISATNAASPVIDEVVASVNSVQASVDSLSASFAALDASSSSVDASLSAINAGAAGADASLATLDASLAGVDASLATIDAEAAAADASLAGIDASASGTAASLTGLAAADGGVVVGFSDMADAAALADSQMAMFAASTAAVTSATSGMAASTAAASMTMKGLRDAQRAAADSQLASLGGMQQIGAELGKIVLIGTAVAAVLGGIAVHAAGDFQSSITKLYTTAGELHSNLQMVGDGILSMSTSVGTGAQQLSQSMYWIESGGLHGTKALEALRVAAEAAKAENANLDKVSIALAASLNAYAGSGMSTVQVMNTLTAATGQGMMTFEQLSGSLASVLPAAAKFHVSLTDVTAALATMTAQGDPAEQAATHLKQVLIALEAPSKIGAAALKSVGLTSTQVANEMKISLPGALKMVTDAVGKKFPEGSAAYNEAIKNIAGGSKQMMGFLELTGQHMDTFAANVKKIGSAVKTGGNDLMGWADIQQNFNFKLDQARAAVEALFIGVGTMLLPVLSQLMGSVTPLIARFTAWISNANNVKQTLTTLAPVLALVAGIVGGILVVAFYAWATATWAALAPLIAATAPILLVIAVAAALGAGLILLYQHFAVVRTVVDAIGTAFGALVHFFTQTDVGTALLIGALTALGVVLLVLAITALPAIIAGLWAWVVAAGAVAVANIIAFWPIYLAVAAIIVIVALVVLAIRHWGEIAHWLQGVWAAVIGWLGGAWHTVVAAATSAWNGIKSALAAVINWISTAWQNVIGWLGGAWHTLAGIATSAWNAVKNAIMSVVNSVVNWLKGAWNTVAGAATSAWNAVKSAIMSVVNGVVNWLKTAWTNAVNWIVNAFQWLYNHNYYWKALVDTIRSVVQSVISWLQTAWHNVTTFIVNQWNTLKADATNAWNGVKNAIMSVVNTVINWLNGQWHAQAATLDSIWGRLKDIATNAWNGVRDAVMSVVNAVINWVKNEWSLFVTGLGIIWDRLKGLATNAWNAVRNAVMSVVSPLIAWGKNEFDRFVSGLGVIWDRLKGLAQSAWDQVVAVFNAVWGRISSILNTLGANIGGFFTNLVGQMLQFGKNIIQGLIDGINSMLGAVGSAASNVASTITGILGFHSPPKEGPAHDSDTWAPNFISMYTAGLMAGLPSINTTVRHLIEPMASSLSPTGNSFAGKGYPTGGGTTTIIVQLPAPVRSDVYLDKEKVGHSVLDYQAKEVRRQGVRNR